MNRAETVFGLGILAFGGLLLEESLKLPYFVEEVPGPGFFPFWLSLAIIAFGLALTVRGARSGAGTSEKGDWPDASGWMRIGIMMGALALCLVLLDSAGFLVTAALFVAVATFGLGTRSWQALLPVPLVAAAVLYGVFAVWLKVPLPSGILGLFG